MDTENLSQTAINNINIILKLLKIKLNDHLYTTDQLVEFIDRSLTLFNSAPPFSAFTFEDTSLIAPFYGTLAQGAACLVMSETWQIEVGIEKGHWLHVM